MSFENQTEYNKFDETDSVKYLEIQIDKILIWEQINHVTIKLIKNLKF